MAGAVISNQFLEDPGAENYDRSRPYFHPLVFARLAQLIPTDLLEQSLDIACGTGQSTQAMAGICKTVVGLDASAAMLRQARGAAFGMFKLSLSTFRSQAANLIWSESVLRSIGSTALVR